MQFVWFAKTGVGIWVIVELFQLRSYAEEQWSVRSSDRARDWTDERRSFLASRFDSVSGLAKMEICNRYYSIGLAGFTAVSLYLLRIGDELTDRSAGICDNATDQSFSRSHRSSVRGGAQGGEGDTAG